MRRVDCDENEEIEWGSAKEPNLSDLIQCSWAGYISMTVPIAFNDITLRNHIK